MLKSGNINTCTHIRSEKKIKEENKIFLKDLISIDDINTGEYIRSEQEKNVRKNITNNINNYFLLHKICLDNILEILEVLNQSYLTIGVFVIFKFV